MPNTVPTIQPIASRASDALRCFHNSPLIVRRYSATAMLAGAGRNSVGIRPSESPSCHSATRPISVAAPASGRLRGAKPPPRNGTAPSTWRMRQAMSPSR